MKRTKKKPIPLLGQVFDIVGDGLTPQLAKRIVAIKLDKKIQSRVRYLGEQANEGLLTAEEDAEYEELIHYDTLLSILQSKARQLLAKTQ